MANNSVFPGFKGVKPVGTYQAKSNPRSMPKQGSAYKAIVSSKSTPAATIRPKTASGL